MIIYIFLLNNDYKNSRLDPRNVGDMTRIRLFNFENDS